MERIRVPFLVTHGAKDRQIALDYAHQSYDAAGQFAARASSRSSPSAKAASSTSGADNMSYGRDYIADWFAEHAGRPHGLNLRRSDEAKPRCAGS